MESGAALQAIADLSRAWLALGDSVSWDSVSHSTFPHWATKPTAGLGAAPRTHSHHGDFRLYKNVFSVWQHNPVQ